MKKVLYIGGFTMPDGNAAAQRVLGIAKALRQCDYDVRFSGLKRNISTSESDNIDGFSYINHPYPTTPTKWLKYLTGHDSSIQEIVAYNPDIVILYNHPAIAIERIANFCRKKGIKVLADVTEWYEPQGNPVFKAIKKYDTNRRMYKSHLTLDGLICISSYLSDFYRKQGAKVIEIPPLIDIDQDKWHQPVNLSNDGIRLVYAGSPGAMKDRLDLILAAMDEIVPTLGKKIKFDVIGITQEQYRSTWGDDKNRDFVVFNGRRPHEEVIKKLLEADFQIFLRPDSLPNRAGFPTKFVETITSGTLPITNLSSNLKDYIINGKNGFIIENLRRESIMATVNNALRRSVEQIKQMRNNLDRTIFDYHKYTLKLKKFLDTL